MHTSKQPTMFPERPFELLWTQSWSGFVYPLEISQRAVSGVHGQTLHSPWRLQREAVYTSVRSVKREQCLSLVELVGDEDLPRVIDVIQSIIREQTKRAEMAIAPPPFTDAQEKQYRQVLSMYDVEEPDDLPDFLRRHSFLLPLLVDAPKQIHAVFGEDVRMEAGLICEDDMPGVWNALNVWVYAPLEFEEAQDRGAVFEADWWGAHKDSARDLLDFLVLGTK